MLIVILITMVVIFTKMTMIIRMVMMTIKERKKYCMQL